MPITNLPSGMLATPNIGGGPAIPTSTGQYFWVASNGLGSVQNFQTSIANALAMCVAGRGDVIICEPGYAETISSATAFNINKSGVSLVGLGNRANRPTLTFATSTAATITISASGVL